MSTSDEDITTESMDSSTSTRPAQTAFDQFLARYDEAPSAQAPEDAEGDRQLQHMILRLAEEIGASESGTVLDVGCGRGVLLSRLLDLPKWRDHPGWLYVGVEREERHPEIWEVALTKRVHRRVELLGLSEFYAAWVQSCECVPPFVIVVRNVLHELDIPATAELLHTLRARLLPTDTVFIQDILTFPEAERGNVCWDPDCLEVLLRDCGFECISVDDTSRRGNWWVTLLAVPGDAPDLTQADVHERVVRRRTEQLKKWDEYGEMRPSRRRARERKLELVDFDLQYAALHRQLRAASHEEIPPLSDERRAVLIRETFTSRLRSVDASGIQAAPVALPQIEYFRDRANNQDRLEEFLLTQTPVCVIRGGPLMGKSVLVAEVLSRRAHRRRPVVVDAQRTSSVWNLLEQYLSGAGCPVSYDAIGGLEDLTLDGVEDAVRTAVNELAPHTILVWDHFERLFDPNGGLEDAQIETMVVMMCSAPGAKVIISTRPGPDFRFLRDHVEVDEEHPGVYRFPRGDHTVNVLDDFVDRAGLGLEAYPTPLLTDIDRVPYLAALAGRIIHQEGQDCVEDKQFLALLRGRLRDELLRRLVTDEARPAAELLSSVRVPIPQAMFEDLVGHCALTAALELGVVYPTFSRGARQLLTGLGVLRPKTEEEWLGFVPEENRSPRGLQEDQQHRRLAAWYDRLFREDRDPVWIRESHYHRLAAGDTEDIRLFGAAYTTELFAAGEYWFHNRKDFRSALEAFRTAERLGLRDYHTRMRLAACLLRVGEVAEGEQLYKRLIRSYADSRGLRMSHIDSLINIRHYEDALAKLGEYELEAAADPWVAGQYGRAYMGLARFAEAAAAFEAQLKQLASPEPVVYYTLAHAYYAMGDLERVRSVLERGRRRHPNSPSLSLQHARVLVHTGSDSDREKAGALLTGLVKERPSDGAVLQQFCKLRCLQGRADEAREHMDEIHWKVFPEHYRQPISAEILIAEGHWERAVSELHSVPSDNRHLVGLKKKAYQRWAEAEEGDRRRDIAARGLDVEMAETLARNIPILWTTAQLARLAGDSTALERVLADMAEVNQHLAHSLRSGDVSDPWWDQASGDW